MKSKLIAFLLAASFVKANAARNYIVAVTPSLPTEWRELAARKTARLLYESEPGTVVTVLDAARLRTVTRFTVPEGTLKLRQGLATPSITNVVNFIQTPSAVAEIVDQPALLEYIGRQVKTDGDDVVLLLMAPALYRNPNDPEFDMTARWPSDGHLTAGRARSMFSTKDRARVLDNVTVSWFVTDSAEFADLRHREAVARFWTLFIGTEGGVLTGYAPDLVNAFALALRGRQNPFQEEHLDPRDTDVTMRSKPWNPVTNSPPQLVFKTVTITNDVTRTNIVTETNRLTLFRETVLPTPATGNALIALVWITPPGASRSVDLDLHVRIPTDGVELSYRHTTSRHGRYHRDIRQSSPSVGGDWKALWEAVELTPGADLPTEVWINCYAGHGPCQGELRVLYRGREHRIAFTFPAVSGNGGADADRRERSDRWLRIDLQSIASQP